MLAYKFSDDLGIQYLLSGIIRFRSLEYYRQLEHSTGNDWIGDKNDGATFTSIADHTFTLASGSADADFMEKVGIQLVGAGSVHMVRPTIRKKYSGFIWSFATGSISDLEKFFA